MLKAKVYGPNKCLFIIVDPNLSEFCKMEPSTEANDKRVCSNHSPVAVPTVCLIRGGSVAHLVEDMSVSGPACFVLLLSSCLLFQRTKGASVSLLLLSTLAQPIVESPMCRRPSLACHVHGRKADCIVGQYPRSWSSSGN